LSSTTRVLILEDDAHRTAEFRRRFQELERASGIRLHVRFVRHVDEAIRELSTRGYGLVLLDHDLNGSSGTSSAEADTGAGLVRWIASEGIDKLECRIIVHSQNASGARKMADVLSSAGVQAECYPGLWKGEVFREAFDGDPGEVWDDDPED